jgi:TonB family protein
MDKVIDYIFESGASLALLTIVYVLFLRKETFFKQNRIFLLGSILFSVIIPLVKLPALTSLGPVMLPEVTVSPYKSILKILTYYGKPDGQDFNAIAGLMNVLIYTYLAGVICFSLRFLYRILRIMLLVKRNEVKEGNGYKLVLIDGYFSPFSFLNFVFVSRSGEKNDDYDKMILHELEHVKQGHTVDILLLEALTVFHWFNPFVWLLKRVVRENHEFLADTGVLSKGVNRVWYKQLLLNQYVGQQYIISNSFNYSLIKKRIKMMSKLRSKKYASIKYLFGIVAATALLVTFGCEQNSALPEEKKPLFFIVEQMPGYPGGEEALLDFIASTVKYPDEAMEKGIEGRVYVSFTISDKGKVMDAKIAKGVDPLLDKEALRVIKSMPDWKPGMQRGVFVNVQFTVPINFSLGEK